MSSVIDVEEAEPTTNRPNTKSKRLFLGLFVLLLVDGVWVSSSELTKYIYTNAEFEKPFFNTYVKTSMFMLYLFGLCFLPQLNTHWVKPHMYTLLNLTIEDDNFYTEANTSLSDSTFVPIKLPETSDRSSPGTDSGDDSTVRSVRFSKLAEVRHMSEADAMEALLARLSYQASVRASEAAKRAAIKFPVKHVATIAFIFCILWFLANYVYHIALSKTEPSAVAVLSSTSSFATLVMAAVLPSNLSDRFTLSKLASVGVSLGSLFAIYASNHRIDVAPSVGTLLAILAAVLFAVFIVLLRRRVDHEDKMDIPLFFGFVGLWNAVLFWPIFFILHHYKVELFEWPNERQWTFLLMNGLVGTVFGDALWLWGLFLTSSLVASVTVSLTVPVAMLADAVLKRVVYSQTLYISTLPLLVAFGAVVLLTYKEDWDPLGTGLRWLCSRIFCCCRKTPQVRVIDTESEHQALIGINDGDLEA